MDKETLSNYGWIVICVLVLAVMIALATPFGNFVASAVKNTTQGLFDVNEEVLLLTAKSTSKEHKFADVVIQGDYAFIYMTCNTIEEFKDGYLVWLANALSDTPICNMTEALESLAIKTMGKSWEELQSTGYTQEQMYQRFGGDTIFASWTNIDGWAMSVADKTKSSYGAIPTHVDGIRITGVDTTFTGCKNLVTAPLLNKGITDASTAFSGCKSLKTYVGSNDEDGDFSNYFVPNTIEDMTAMFQYCENIKKAPKISTSAKDLQATFAYCYALQTAPTIPSSVTNLYSAFYNCTSLTGEIEINANPTKYGDCFKGVDFNAQNITLTGTSNMLDELGATGINYCATCNGKCQNNH